MKFSKTGKIKSGKSGPPPSPNTRELLFSVSKRGKARLSRNFKRTDKGLIASKQPAQRRNAAYKPYPPAGAPLPCQSPPFRTSTPPRGFALSGKALPTPPSL